MGLQSKSVVVIGGSSGMGLATAKLAKEMGAKVTIASRSKAKLDQALQHIGEALAITADITNESLDFCSDRSGPRSLTTADTGGQFLGARRTAPSQPLGVVGLERIAWAQKRRQ